MNHQPSAEPGQWLRDVKSMTAGKVPVRLSPDYLVGFPVEVVVSGHPGYVGPSMLGISAALARDLEAFQEGWEERFPFDGDDDDDDDYEDVDPNTVDDPSWTTWEQSGWRLVERLQAELGPDCEVTWIDTPLRDESSPD
jgi:hypothetical protein